MINNLQMPSLRNDPRAFNRWAFGPMSEEERKLIESLLDEELVQEDKEKVSAAHPSGVNND